jgi:hypothetical protein
MVPCVLGFILHPSIRRDMTMDNGSVVATLEGLFRMIATAETIEECKEEFFAPLALHFL